MSDSVSKNINVSNESEGAVYDDLVKKAQRFGLFGYFLAFLFALALVVQNLVYSLLPKEVWASEDGKVIGQVVFDEPMLRSSDVVLGDFKDWAGYCTTVKKGRVFEDLAVCVNHMNTDLANRQIEEYEKTQYGAWVETYGCEKTQVTFDDRTVIERSENRIDVVAKIYGQQLCTDTEKAQDFAIYVKAELTHKTLASPLGFEVIEWSDIND